MSSAMTGRLNLRCLAAIVGCLAANICGSAHATSLWYDGFDLNQYTAGTPLGGQSGGAGSFFTGAWVPAGYPPLANNTQVITTGLSRPGLTAPTTGGSASMGDPGFAAGACQYDYGGCYESRTSRLMTDPWAGFTNPDGTFYVSFLANFGYDAAIEAAKDIHHRVFEMHLSGLDDSQRQLMLGVSSFAGEFLGSKKLSLAVHDSNASAWQAAQLLPGGNSVSTANLAFQGTHLLVLKFQMSNSGNDVVSAFLDPVGTVEPAPDAQVSVGEFLADRMSALVQFTYDSHPKAFFDEIRVGSEFGDVAINTLPLDIPEPASLSLLGLGMLGALLSVRWKRSWAPR